MQTRKYYVQKNKASQSNKICFLAPKKQIIELLIIIMGTWENLN